VPRWQDTYDALTGERYAGLLAYALLYVDDLERAGTLVAAAVRQALSRGRTFPGGDQVESGLRTAIARAVVESAPRSTPAEPVATTPAPSEPHASTFAPPAIDSTAEAIASETSDYVPQHETVASVLRDFDPRTRAAVILRHHDGHTVRRVAEITGMRPDEVTTRLTSAAAELSARTGVSVASAVQDDALAGIEMTVTTQPARRRRG
jgi:DNA-directed RNA polymerase specialized sigma24 family protein